MDPKIKAMRALFRPKLPEGTQCASCPFRQGNDAEFKKVVIALKHSAGLKPKATKRDVFLARLRVRGDVEHRGDFICHRTFYGQDMERLDPALHRQCPGATKAFKGLES